MSKNLDTSSWLALSGSRALFSMLRGIDSRTFNVDTRWKKARFFAFTFNKSKLPVPGRSPVIVDLCFSEFTADFSTHVPNRLRTMRYIIRRSLSAPVETGVS
jgi:hypothetical protein